MGFWPNLFHNRKNRARKAEEKEVWGAELGGEGEEGEKGEKSNRSRKESKQELEGVI